MRLALNPALTAAMVSEDMEYFGGGGGISTPRRSQKLKKPDSIRDLDIEGSDGVWHELKIPGGAWSVRTHRRTYSAEDLWRVLQLMTLKISKAVDFLVLDVGKNPH